MSQMSLKEGFRQSGAGPYALIALFLLVIVDELFSVAFQALAPDIGRSLHIDKGSLSFVTGIRGAALLLGALPVLAIVHRIGRPVAISVATGIVWSAVTLLASLAGGLFVLLAVGLLDGLSSASVGTLHRPILMDRYVPGIRLRVLSLYGSGGLIAGISASYLVAFLTGPLELDWRGTFVLLGVLCMVAATVALGLRDRPGSERSVVTAAHDGFWQAFWRVVKVPTIQRCLLFFVVTGVLVGPLVIFMSFFLSNHFHLSASGIALFHGTTSAMGVLGLLAFGPIGDRWFSKEPASLIRRGAIGFSISVAALPIATVMPNVYLAALVVGVGLTVPAALTPGFLGAFLSVVDQRYRPHAQTLYGIMAALGIPPGILLLTQIQHGFGDTVAFTALTGFAVVAAAVLFSAASTINADVARARAEEPAPEAVLA